MGISVLQPSFASGEMAPTLYGRVDLARYQIGLKTCRNFLIMQHGGARNRPGTRYVDTTLGNAQARLIRFKFSVGDACVLVFTNLKMRVIRNGAYVLNSTGPSIGLPFELTTPYTLADLYQIGYTQSADVMTLVHTSYKPQDLKRFANDNWTITPVVLLPSINPPATAVAANSGGSGTAINWQYQVTAVIDNSSTIEESLPVSSNIISVFPGALLATLNWAAVAGATYYNIYKDNSGAGVFGFTGRSTTLGFTDNNVVPTKTDTPPSGLDPFVGAGNFPGAVGYYQQRKVYGGTLNKPQTSYFSRTGVFNNFGYSTPAKDDDAITWTMASTEVNRILNYLPLRQLLTLTSGNEWIIQGESSGFTAKTINGVPQSYNGSGFVPPLVLNDTAMYLQDRGQIVSSLNYSLEADGLSGQDLTVWSSHLFRNYSITDWCYQKSPESIVWSVRSDGVMLGLTYQRSQDLVAWHHHDTDGAIEAVCCVPEAQEDAVYMVVRRVINGATKRYIERMQTRNIPLIAGTMKVDVAQAYFVDCGLSYQGWNTTVNTLTLSGGTTWQYPEVLTLTNSAGTGFVLGDVGKQIHIRDPLTLSDLRMDITGYTSAGVVSVIPIGIVPADLRGVATTAWAKALKTFSNVNHLEGKAVSILADGNVVSGLSVAGGIVTLPRHAAVVHIGLPYVSDLETLNINVTGQETLLDKNKMVSSVTLVVDESRGIFAGSDAGHLFEVKSRAYEDYNDPATLKSEVVEIRITNDWDGQGNVFVRQTDPLPLTILGIIPELTIAGKK